MLSRTIVSTLSQTPGISYAQIARAALDSNQPRLAQLLLDHEPCAASQVPLLLSMGGDESGLDKAIESGDGDLIYLALLHMKRKMVRADFFRIVGGKSVARSWLVCYARQCDTGLLRDFYYQDDRRGESAKLIIQECLGIADSSDKVAKLKMAYKLYSDDKDYTFESKSTDEYIRLVGVQAQLERDTGHTFVGMSVSESIGKCLSLGHANRATKIQKDFKVPDKRFWWLKVKALVTSHNWEGLEKFVKATPKFAVGGVIELLIKHGQASQANKYIDILVRSGQAGEQAGKKYIEEVHALETRSRQGSGTNSR